MKKTSRRQFISNASQLALGVSTIPSIVQARNYKASQFTLALSQYSLREMLADGSLNFLDFPAFTVETFGINAVDIWERAIPTDKLDNIAYLEKLRNRASQVGTELFLLMVDVLNVDSSERESSLKTILPSLDRAAILGCEFLRVFIRVPGKDVDAGVKPSVEALKPLADAAAEKKVVIVIEPGASVISQKGAFLAEVVKELNHPGCKLMPDFGKLKNNVYDGTEAMLPFTASVSAKMHEFDEFGDQLEFDYYRLIKMIAQSGYKGYIAIEWEGKNLPPIEGVKASQKLIQKAIAAL